jgi:probable HAF family extracellular repeat protein
MKLRLVLLIVLLITDAAVRSEIRYRVVPIRPPAGIDAYGMGALGINNHGQVVGEFGYFFDPSNQWEGQSLKAFLFSGGTNAVELDIPTVLVSSAVGINNSGQIATYGSPVQPVAFDSYRFSPDVGYEPLGSFGGETETEAINEVGQVTGFSVGTDGRSYAFRYTDGVGMENIGTNFASASRGFAINDQGWVAGYGDGYAFLYRDDQGVISLGPGRAYGINNHGSVVGVSWMTATDLGFIYLNGELILVGPEEGPETVVGDINNYDVAVGEGVQYDGVCCLKVVGLIWTKSESLLRLNSFIPQDSGWWLTTAAAINDYGQIVGSGSLNGQSLAYRLDPIPPKLSIQHSPTNLTVSWSPAWPGLVLESSESLSAQDWKAMDTGGTNVVALPMEPRQRFFRLNLEGIRGLCCAPE